MGLLDKLNILDIRGSLGNKPRGFKLEDREEFGIVRSTLTKYGLPTMNFDENLSSLSINEDYNIDSYHGKSDTIAGSYLYRTNTLNLPDKKEDVIHELFHMASNYFENKELLPGCEKRGNNRNFGKSLNEGIVDYFTSLSVEGYESRYPVELFFANYLSKIYGFNIFKEFFNGDADKFYDSFKPDDLFIMNIVTFLDNYHYSLSKYIDLASQGKTEEGLVDEITDSFVDCVSELLRLLQLKKMDEKPVIDELRQLMNKDTDFINNINFVFMSSSYRGTQTVFNEIIEEIDAEGFNL